MLPTKAERRTFLEERQGGLGGSDIAAIVGEDSFRGPLDVYLEKTRPIEDEALTSHHLIRGIMLEDDIADLYAAETGRNLSAWPASEHPDLPWARVNIDRMVWAEGEHEEAGVLEIKAPGRESFHTMIEQGVYSGYLIQLQWGMWVTGRDWGSFAIGNFESPRGPLVHFDVERDSDMIDGLVPLAEEFWQNHVLAGVPPTDFSRLPGELPFPSLDPEVHTLTTVDAIEVVTRLITYRSMWREGEELYTDFREIAKHYLVDIGCEKVNVPGVGKLYYTARDGRRTFDDKALAAHRPLDWDKVRDLLENTAAEHGLDRNSPPITELLDHCTLDLAQFTKQGSPYRDFRTYPAKEEP